MNVNINECIFCLISEGESKADIVYSDREFIVVDDINPQAPVHFLVIPRIHISNLKESSPRLLGHLLSIASNIAEKKGVSEKGFRLVINCGPQGGQEVDHLHAHVMGGRQMEWPPG